MRRPGNWAAVDVFGLARVRPIDLRALGVSLRCRLEVTSDEGTLVGLERTVVKVRDPQQ